MYVRASSLLALLLLAFFACSLPTWAADEEAAPAPPPTVEGVKKELDTQAATAANMKVAADTVWVLITAMLVFFMNLGFACVESGFCRAKNAVNILSKNFIVFAVTSIGFLLLGFGLMFGGGSGWLGLEGIWMVGGADNSPLMGGDYKGVYGALNWTGTPLWAKFFFQLVFAGTAATIVSGAVAERIKYHSFIVFSFIMAIAIYPIVGHWIWGGGVLAPGTDNWFGENAGFFDFAGSTVVHSVGGWAALAGILVLGARIGKYGPNGRINAIPGHNLTAATIGCFVLWFGWFGFNPGSTMAADFNAIGRICITTNTAAAAATITATITAWIMLGKPDLGMTLNGCLAGLVAITAPCMFVTVQSALIIGLIAGVLVVLAVQMFDRLKIDDPVGATSVHLVNGVFGTICVGLFGVTKLAQGTDAQGADVMVETSLKNNGLFMGGGMAQLLPQLVGVGLVAVYVFVVALIAWMVLKYTVGIRVSPEEEVEGLDLGEHGNEAYHGFVMAAEPVYSSSEPRPASVPPDSKRFSVVVEGVENGDLMHAWSELCQPAGKGGPTPDFKAVYPHVTTVQGNRFRCRGGEPEVVRGSLEKLLQSRMQAKGLRVRVDK